MKSTLCISSDFRNFRTSPGENKMQNRKKMAAPSIFSPSTSYWQLIKAHEDNVITLDFTKRTLKLQN